MTEQTDILKNLIFEKKHLLAEYKDDILKQLEALCKVAKRVGVPAPTWTMGDTYEYEFEIIVGSAVDVHEGGIDVEYETFIEPVFDITINLSECIKMAGDWRLVAAINHRTESILQIDEAFELPARFTPKKDVCEHCNVSTPRVMSYIIHSEANGFKQVGKTCLKQFLGINPASYISMFEAISKFSPIIESMGFRKNRGGRLDNLAYNVEDIFKLTYRIVENEGKFIKNEWKEVESGKTDWKGEPYMMNVRTNQGDSTLDKVNERLFIMDTYKRYPNELQFAITLTENVGIEKAKTFVAKAESQVTVMTAQHIAFNSEESKEELNEARAELNSAQNILLAISKYQLHTDTLAISDTYKPMLESVKKWASELTINISEGNVMNSFDEFKQGIKDIYSKPRTLQSRAKYIVSAYNMYMIDLQKKAEREERAKKAETQEYIGTIGQKMRLELTVTGYKTGEGNFGMWELWNMEDANGNQFRKFGKLNEKYVTGDLDLVYNPNNYTTLPVDEKAAKQPKITATFEIKDHEIFKESKVTALGRISKP